MSFTKFTNCHLCDQGTILNDGELYVDNSTGRIVNKPEKGAKVEVVDLEGNILAPGFIDIQNNGIFGLNFSSLNAESSEEDVAGFINHYRDAMAKYLGTGVTAICPTVTSNFPEVYEKVLPVYKASRSGAQTDSLGAHCEGPFINIKKKGCHPVETFTDAKGGCKDICRVYGGNNLCEYVTIVTVAPEIEGILDVITDLKQKNITVSIGHSAADYETGLQAIENGATMITHLYNAMPQPHHRDVGVVGLISSPIAKTTPYFGLITDGVHVDPAMATIAYRSNPDKCIVVTDAMHLIGLPDGTYKWDNQQITKSGPKLYLKGTKTLAGAATSLPQCMRNLRAWTNISLAEAIKTVTNNPAKSIGVQQKKGFLNVGCDADLVVLDKNGFVKNVYKLGKPIKSSDENQPPKLMAAL
ncbi:uncharacterized protein AC631_00513 [Debaryomyces fabryi]|uniref:N-acetylglucosamine-6-phosphate deacetylase n=1 Tax=Debaryomyces fabryi TaxID=58627 RepID=A0A0V1Q5Z8_9ASCO|nr:uncharacterized protein AC631_00513 [Debaryomyces fabryi]KSA03701.1 hypothetical protein AC631_00513 [Debaryomyces fabryi]CUM53410.1 unnamed protein product [Debaryomyces fabryi]